MDRGRDRKPHIGIFGRRNSGKSSIINCLTGQETAIVSDVAGTTTDPVKKSVEVLGIGASVIIDTAGIDDTGPLGEKRVKKTMQAIKQVDLAILVFNSNHFDKQEETLIHEFDKYNIPWFAVHNKSDIEKLTPSTLEIIKEKYKVPVIDFSALSNSKPELITTQIKNLLPVSAYTQPSMMGGLVNYGDIVLLIVPIDAEAPEGRLILPQVQAIRDILDNECVAIVLKERELDSFLKKTGIKPKLAVTDSSIFLKASASVPADIPLTGFSILLARLKGEFYHYLKGTPIISSLHDGDRILMLESCTHQMSCDDIGRVKIPRWMSSFTGKKLEFDIVAGLDEINRPVTSYALVVQCGGCMVTGRQLTSRLKPFIEAGIPVTNYGMAIAYLQGIYERAISPFVRDGKFHDSYL